MKNLSKKLRAIFILIAFLSVLINFSCKEDSSNPNKTNFKYKIEDYFPITHGSWWGYQSCDSINAQDYCIQRILNQDTTIDNHVYRIAKCGEGIHDDLLQYFRYENNSLVYRLEGYNEDYIKVNLNKNKNELWDYLYIPKNIIYTYRFEIVNFDTTITVLNKIYNNCIFIKSHYIFEKQEIIEHYFYAKGIGLVFSIVNANLDNKGYCRLRDYHIEK
jgi:hypothetical protein